MTPPSRLRTCAAVIGVALLAEVVVYLGVLFAYSIAGVQPAQQITCCELSAVRREAFDATVLPHMMITQTIYPDDPCSRVTSLAPWTHTESRDKSE